MIGAAVLLPGVLAMTGCATGIVLCGARAVRGFVAACRAPPRERPPVSVLKPLCGDEPMLEAALATICEQAYPGLQIVFGVHGACDPALRAVEAVRRRFPAVEMTVVADGTLHGPNRKVSNLINMLPAARHDVLILSDSDLHVPPDYVEQVVAALERPGVGLVTTLCTGLPTAPGLVSRFGGTAITHSFLPGALMSRALGREDCLGTTMAVRRDTLERAGGLAALVRHVADDHVFAQRVLGIGLHVGLAAVIAKTGVPEHGARLLYQHELRWARTIRAVEPGLFGTSVLQYPLFWAAMAVLCAGGAGWAWAVFAVVWAIRAGAAVSVDWTLGLAGTRQAAPLLLLPLRDVWSVSLVAASYFGSRVVWRGAVMRVARPGVRPPGVPDRAEGAALALAAQDRVAAVGSRPATGG